MAETKSKERNVKAVKADDDEVDEQIEIGDGGGV